MTLSKNYPHLIAEWHQTKNKGANLNDFTHGSNQSCWWQCRKEKGHEWLAPISARVVGKGCPYCSGNKVNGTNCLAAVYPKFAKEWHPTKNHDLTPETVFFKSTKKIWWKCDNGPDHEWLKSPRNRAKEKTNCLFCDGQKLSVTNSLKKTYPEIAAQWHTEKNGQLTSADVTYKYRKSVWWKCDNGPDHEWESSVNSRVLHPSCPFCAGNRPSINNNLKSKFPEIANEWDYDKNYPKKPEDYTHGSGEIVHWKCSFDPSHLWPARINSRTTSSQMSGCRWCTARQRSDPELRILAELKLLFPDILYRERIEGCEVDLYIPSLSLGIEYDGWYYHKNKKNQDIAKNHFFHQRNIRLIRVRRSPLKSIGLDDIISRNDEIKKGDINALLIKIKPLLTFKQAHEINTYLECESFQNEYLFNQYLAQFPKPFFKDSLEALYPELTEEWDFKRNHPLKPNDFTPGSDKKVFWQCVVNSSHFWKASISHRTNSKRPTRCPHCFGRGPHKKLTLENAFSTIYPEAAQEWHPTKNGNLKIEDVSFGSGKMGYWLCSCCGKSWSSKIRKHKIAGCSAKCKRAIRASNRMP